MNTRFVFFAIILILSGIIIILFLSISGKGIYSIHGDVPDISGEMLFQSNCAKCHGSAGEGVAAYPEIRNRKLSKVETKKPISRGSGEMPPFPDFNETESELLIEYVREL
jgi:hypothetical protein